MVYFDDKIQAQKSIVSKNVYKVKERPKRDGTNMNINKGIQQDNSKLIQLVDK